MVDVFLCVCFQQVVYSSSKAAKTCVEKLNRTSKMGNIMNVFVDTFGTLWRQRHLALVPLSRCRVLVVLVFLFDFIFFCKARHCGTFTHFS